MVIERKEENMKGAFLARDKGKEAGKMTYSVRNDGKIVIEETEVEEDFREEGLGKKLVLAAVEHARLNDLKVITECSFAEAMFQKNPNYRDVWDKKK